jgi:hypothetical protein
MLNLMKLLYIILITTFKILQITENLQENSEGLILLSKPIPRPIEFKTTTAIIEFEMIWVFSDVKNKPRVLKGDESGWVEI